MATYYKYVERDTSDYINWAEVGKNMSDMLAETNRVREEQKAFIDEKSREFGTTLSNAPQGESKSANEYTLNYANNAAEMMRMQDRLLKSGQLKVKDYLVARQNLMDGTDQAFNSVKTYQQRYAELMERARTDKSAAYELDVMQRAEQFGNFSKSSLYINPTNGQVSVALKDKDGKMSTNPNDFMSVAALNGLLLGRWDKFDTNKATDQFAKSLGTYTDMIRNVGGRYKAGELITMKDITNRTDIDPATKDIIFKFQQAEESGLNAILANDFNRMSVLTDYVKFSPNGKQYRFTRDKEDAKNNMEAILMEYDEETGMEKPVFTQAQMDISLKFLRDEARRKYDIEKNISTYTDQIQETRARDTSGDDKKKADETAVGYWNTIFTGTNEQKKVAVQQILGTQYAQGKGLIDLDISTPGQITFKYLNAPERTINYDPNSITLGEWSALGNEAHGVDNALTVMKRAGGGDPSATLTQSDFGGVRAARAAQAPQADARSRYTDIVAEINPEFFGKKEYEAARLLKPILAPLGVTVRPSTSMISNVLTIQAKGKPAITVNTNTYTSSGTKTEMNKLIEYLNESFSDDTYLKSVLAPAAAPAATGGASSRIANY